MEDHSALLARWQITPAEAREYIYRAKTSRERERWHALWLFSQGCSAAQVARALERDPPTSGEWRSRLCGGGTTRPRIHPKWWLPPALQPEQQAALTAAGASAPAQAGVPLAKWTWRGVRHFLREHVHLELSRSRCLRWVHRLGFPWKRPKQHLLKADTKKQAACVQQ